MKSMKALPESCITCICHLSNMRSCRNYDCKDFPVHERVCAGIEFDTSVQKALDRYEIRLKSSCRAAKEQLEKILMYLKMKKNQIQTQRILTVIK